METITHQPLVLERTYDAPANKIWQALTDTQQMKQWYFDVRDFAPVVGTEFSFSANCDGDQEDYLHLCKVTEAIENKKIAYTWRYADYEGNSEVSFELFDESGKTKLVITHKGLESFPQTGNFRRECFNEGWTYYIGALNDFLNK